MSPVVVVTGTGTEIGKTALSEALLIAWSRTRRVAGLKPIESGHVPGTGDAFRLEQVSTFHVTRFTPPYLFRAPVSPLLAARQEGRAIDPRVITDWLTPFRDQAEGVLVELAGGLFSPITDELSNADLTRAIAPTHVLLVAPDRLGVLHDVTATVRAAAALDVAIDGVLLSAPLEPDASTGTNARELDLVLRGRPPVLVSLPRAAASVLADHLAPLVARLGL